MRAFIVVGLGFGDEGKGTITDYLAREYDAGWVVRYNGGAQAAHNVLSDGGQHTFAQFGAATFVPGVKTFLSRHMLVNPLDIFAEERHLIEVGVHDAFDRLHIDADAAITTPFHVAVNQIKEIARDGERHGSCGKGIGETVEDEQNGMVIRMADLGTRRLKKKLRKIQEYNREKAAEFRREHGPTFIGSAQFDRAVDTLVNPEEVEACAQVYKTLFRLANVVVDHEFAEDDTVIFEGAQGVLLDQDYGFQPHTTWSRCTTLNAEGLLDPYDADVTRVGVTRAYATRHGAGPFPTERHPLTRGISDPNNRTGPWQGAFRVGYTDLVLLRYALDVQMEAGPGIDWLAVTCLDPVERRGRWQVASAYRHPERGVISTLGVDVEPTFDGQRRLAETLSEVEPMYDGIKASYVADLLAEVAGVDVVVESRGPSARDKTVRVPA